MADNASSILLKYSQADLNTANKTIGELLRLLYLGNFIAEDNLLLWLDGKDFTNAPNTTTWLDKSGNGYNMAMNGMSYTTSSGSDGANGVIFDGVKDFGQIADNADIELTVNWTIELNVKIAHGQATKFPISKGSASAIDYSLIYGFVTSDYELYSDKLSTVRPGTIINASDGLFHLIAYTDRKSVV